MQGFGFKTFVSLILMGERKSTLWEEKERPAIRAAQIDNLRSYFFIIKGKEQGGGV